ncbi:putative CheA signal transduction histidine kinase [Paucimonas lemoignei]|jgi:hypothetical protein|nr:putative CheA signal transduction histidine kinase [Paucimonas lemoignei]
MLNGTDWPTTHPDFIAEAPLLLARCQECLAHLALIADDTDALDGLLDSLSRLADKARRAQIDCSAGLCRELWRLLAPACVDNPLSSETQTLVGECLTLLAWHLELIDPGTGQLPLDQAEQRELLGKVALSCQSRASRVDGEKHIPHCDAADSIAVSQYAAPR